MIRVLLLFLSLVLAGHAEALEPSTRILDSGTRANESPLSNGGNWSLYASDFQGSLAVVSNQITPPVGFITGEYGSYWSSEWFTANQEVYATVPTIQGTFLGLHLPLRIQNPGVAFSSLQFYELSYWTDTNHFYYVRWPGNNVLATVSSITLAAGDSVWFTVVGSHLQGYYKTGGVWQAIDGGVDDTTYSTGGYLGIYTDTDSAKAAAALTNVGGGSLTIPSRTKTGVGP